jgi:hypothetical protein
MYFSNRVLSFCHAGQEHDPPIYKAEITGTTGMTGRPRPPCPPFYWLRWSLSELFESCWSGTLILQICDLSLPPE